MNKYFILILWFSSFVALGQQKNYEFRRENNQVIVSPQLGGFDLNLNNLGSCDDLYDSLEKHRLFLETCLKNDRSEQSCLVVKRKLYHLLWGQKETFRGLSAPEGVEGKVNNTSVVDLVDRESIAKELGVDPSQVFYAEATGNPLTLESLAVQVGPESWINLIGKLKLNKKVDKIILGEEGKITFGNKLIACDVVNRKAKLEVKAHREFSFSEATSIETLTKYWELYLGIQKIDQESKDNSYVEKSLKIGVFLGQTVESEGEVKIEVAVDSFLKMGKYSFRTVKFDNAFQLRPLLPSSEGSFTGNINLRMRRPQ